MVATVDYNTLKKELAEIAQIVQQYPDQMQSEVFSLLIENLTGSKPGSTSRRNVVEVTKGADTPAGQTEGAEEPARRKPSSSKRAATKESYKLDRNLNLRGDKSIPAFRDFVKEKHPGPAKEFNAVAVYYLKKLAGIETVTLDHVYTCYDEVKKRPPEHFKQSLIDTKNKEGWVEFDEAGNLNIPHRGVVFVEHDLPHGDAADSATK